MGAKGAALSVQELNFLQNRLGLGQGFDPNQFKNAAPTQNTLTTPDDEAALRSMLLQSVGGSTAGAATSQAGIQDIISRLLGVQQQTAAQPNLAVLDAGAQGSLDAITRANQDKLNLQRRDAENTLVQNLFGNGTAQSSIALDQAGRLNYGADQLQSQLLADAANRELGLRNSVSDRALQSFGLQSNTLGQAGGLAVSGGELQNRDAALRSSLLESSLNRGLTRDTTNAGLIENERQRGFGQDQFRQSLLANLGQQVAGVQGTRTSPLPGIINGALGLASMAIPGGGTFGSTLLRKIPGLSSIFKPSGATPAGGIG